MDIFYNEHRLILENLIRHNVDFILVGGYAVNYHGYNRSTGDMDIWLRPDNDNKLLLLSALGEIGYEKAGLDVIEEWDFTKPQGFYIGKDPERTDFMTFISGVTFSETKKMVIAAAIEGLLLPVIQLNDLIKNKTSTGRGKDLIDVEYLEKIVKLKKTEISKRRN